jgi:hypothetical protein
LDGLKWLEWNQNRMVGIWENFPKHYKILSEMKLILICFVFWTWRKYTGHFGWNESELKTLSQKGCSIMMACAASTKFQTWPFMVMMESSWCGLPYMAVHDDEGLLMLLWHRLFFSFSLLSRLFNLCVWLYFILFYIKFDPYFFNAIFSNNCSLVLQN